LRDLLTDLMDAAARRASYAEVRHVRTRTERLAVRNGSPVALDHAEEEGFGVRVRVGGAWAFAASAGSDPAAARAALSRALAVARAQPGVPEAPLTDEPPAQGDHRSPMDLDPFQVSIGDKLELLMRADEALRAEPGVVVARSHVMARTEEKSFASTEGALCTQALTECGGGIEATAVNEAGAQVRSYPGSHSGHVAQAGWEHVLGLDLPGTAPRVAAEAAELLRAPACPAGPATLVLGGEQLAIQLHESVGHAVELDRVLGGEASYAGTSFVAPGDAGELRYGSPLMNVTADATLPAGLGSFAWDDEGVAARAVPIVREGVLHGFLSSRESAAAIGLERSGGCMRAEGFARQPIVRMTNVSLDPGAAGTLEDLIADTERGVYVDTNRSWSIDSRRLHFQFAGEAAWEIRDGRLSRMLRDPVYAGVTPAFWAGMDAVCSPEAWRLMSVTDCGKGEPGQFGHVSHGCAPARFRDVEMGAG
jgi:TldD protein